MPQTAMACLNSTAIAPSCSYSSVKLKRKLGEKNIRQHRKVFLEACIVGWTGQFCEEFITDMESKNDHRIIQVGKDP